MRVLSLLVVLLASPALAQPKVLEGHTEPVYAAAFTPDGKWIVTASFDETVKLWDAATGKVARTMTGHQGLVLAVAVARDGSRIASGGADRTIKLWDVPTSGPTAKLEGHTGAVNAVAVSADGKWYATGGADKVLKLRSTEDDTVRDVAGHEAAITRVDFRADVQQVASGDESGIVRVFNPADGAPLGVIGAHAGKVTGVAWAPNNAFLLTSGDDGYVRRWPNTLPKSRTIDGHGGPVTRVRISPNGARAVSTSADKTVRLWNFADGKPLKTLEGTGPVAAVGFTYNSAQVATGGDDKIARLFDANNGNPVKAFPAMPEKVTAVAVSANNQEIAVGDAKGNVTIFKTADATELRKLEGHTAAITGLAYTPNSAAIVSASRDKTVRVWKPADGTEQRKIEPGAAVACLAVSADSARLAIGSEKTVRTYQIGDGKPLLTLEGHAGNVTGVDFSRDNLRIVSGSDDGDVRIWDRTKQVVLQHFPLPKGATSASFHTDHKTIAYAGATNEIRIDTTSALFAHRADETAVNDLAIASNSATYVTAGESGAVKQWNAANGATTREFPGPTGPATSVSLTPNAAQVAAGSKDKTAYVWNAAGQLQYEIKSPAEVTHVAFSPDGKKLVAIGADKSIRGYDPTPPNPQPTEPQPREVTQTLSGHEQSIAGLAFAPDNRTLLTASADGTARTWAIAAAGMTASLTGHGDAVYGLAFSADGKRLVSTSNDKTARTWDVVANKALATISPTANGTLYGVAVSADGTRAVTAGADNSVRLFDLANGTQVRRFTGPEYALYDVAISPDGTTIAAGGMGLGGERPVFVWNVEKEQPTKQLLGHTDDCYAVEFNADGTRLLTAGYAGKVKVWDLAAGKPAFETDLEQVVYSATYAPDGSRIAVCAGDGRVHMLHVPTNAR